MLKERKNYETALEAQLAEWKADMDVLRAKAKRAEVGAKVSYDEALEAMERKHAEASARLHDLKEATDDVWEGLKARTESTWEDLKSLFHTAVH